MKTNFSRIVVGSVLFALTFLALPVSAASHVHEPNVASINAYVSAQMQANHLPGLALGIVHDKQVVNLRSFGPADQPGRAVTPHTPFMIGSLTKSFTALAILQLIEAGKVQLDASVQHYLPWFRLVDPAASAQITVHQLLNQTSGIPSSLNGLNISEIATMNMEQFVHALKAVSLDRPVGSTFEYANTNYVVLGLLVQTVSGQAYGTYIQQHIFAPLQMHNSFASVEEAKQSGLAQGYQWAFGVPVPADDPDLHNAHLLPAGLLASTAEDMSHYLIAQLNNGYFGNSAVVSPRGIATMQTPAVSSATAFGPGSRYGMGWISGPVGGVPVLYYDGITYTFHAYMLIEPHNHWGVVLLFNMYSILADGVAFKQIESGIARLLAGQQPSAASLSLNTLYLILDSLIVLILALVVWSLLRLPRWYQRFGQRPEHRVRCAILPLLRELVLPALLLLVTFTVFGGLWPQLITFQADLTYAYLAILGLVLITGIIRIVLMFLVLRQKTADASLMASPPRQPNLA